jgi:hypothetical protein
MELLKRECWGFNYIYAVIGIIMEIDHLVMATDIDLW